MNTFSSLPHCTSVRLHIFSLCRITATQLWCAFGLSVSCVGIRIQVLMYVLLIIHIIKLF